MVPHFNRDLHSIEDLEAFAGLLEGPEGPEGPEGH
jgi:hypothetical protein